MKRAATEYQPPPEGWLDFGAHAVLDRVPQEVQFSTEEAEDGLPRWERHPGCTCALGQP